jgi:hypothetical protein
VRHRGPQTFVESGFGPAAVFRGDDQELLAAVPADMIIFPQVQLKPTSTSSPAW